MRNAHGTGLTFIAQLGGGRCVRQGLHQQSHKTLYPRSYPPGALLDGPRSTRLPEAYSFVSCPPVPRSRRARLQTAGPGDARATALLISLQLEGSPGHDELDEAPPRLEGPSWRVFPLC